LSLPDLRILLDENLDWRLERDLSGHDVTSVQKVGWAGITNGELIARAEGWFDVLITMDAGFIQELNMVERKIAVIVLRARSNRLADTRPLMPKILAILKTITAGSVTTVSL
jgi:predicted nuclease of predicted toxin-antitoxin system